jgi:low temperature requirement protein LtrA
MNAAARDVRDQPCRVPAPTGAAGAAGQGEDADRRVTPLELFFDLVFVFGITQVTSLLYRDPAWPRLLEAAAILMVLWFAWSGYLWLGNTAATDGAAVRVVLLGAMGPLLVVSLAVPHAFARDAFVFGAAFLLVRALHIAGYLLVAAGDATLRAVVVRLAWTGLPAGALLVVAGTLPNPGRVLCWLVALTIDYGGLLVTGTRDWRLEPAHFAERHGLVIIIALGESIVAIGTGAGRFQLGTGVVVAALLGIAVAAALWWAYFDVLATVAERKLRAAVGEAQARLARDSYSYLHLPMVAGIMLFAFGARMTLAHVHAHLHSLPAAALCGGVAAYLLALSAFRRRNIGSFDVPQLVAAAALLSLPWAASRMPALAALAAVAAICCGLIAVELWHHTQARRRIRIG